MRFFSALKKVPYWYLIVVPLLLMFLGGASNQAVLIANWGKFPVMMNERRVERIQAQACLIQNLEGQTGALFPVRTAVLRPAQKRLKPVACRTTQFVDETHSIMGRNSRLKFLADYINLGTVICSPGDLVFWLGEWLWSVTSILWLGFAVQILVRQEKV